MADGGPLSTLHGSYDQCLPQFPHQLQVNLIVTKNPFLPDVWVRVIQKVDLEGGDIHPSFCAGLFPGLCDKCPIAVSDKHRGSHCGLYLCGDNSDLDSSEMCVVRQEQWNCGGGRGEE